MIKKVIGVITAAAMIFSLTPAMAADGARQEAAAYLAQGYESDYLISNFELSEEGFAAGDGVSVIQSQANPYEGKKSLSAAAQKVAPGKTITLHKSFDEAVNTEKYPYFAFGINTTLTADEGWTPNIPTEVELVFYAGSDTISAKLTVPPSKWQAVAVDFSGLDVKKITAVDILCGNSTINTTFSAAISIDRVAFSKEKPEATPPEPGMDFSELPDGVEEAAITTSQSLYPVSLIADFEKDTEGFAAGENVASLTAVFSSRMADGSYNDAFRPYDGTQYLEVAAKPDQPSGLWKTVSKEVNLDATDFPVLSLAARSWDIGSTMNPPQIRIVVYSYDDAIGGIANITGNNWNILNLDLSGWPYKNGITKIEISSRIKGHFTFNWQQNFHIDTLCFTSPRVAGDNGSQGDISELAPLAVSAQMRDGAQKLPVSYFTRPETEELLNDFDRGTGGWVGTENVVTPLVSTKYSIANGQQLVGLPSVSGNMLEAEALPVLGSDWKRIQRRFATPLNVTKTPVFNFGARSWGGFVTPFVGRVLFISGANTCLGEFTYSADGWTYPAIDLSGWQYKNVIDAIEISFSATAVTSPWNYKTQFDEMGFTTSGGTTAAPDTRFEGMAESLAKKLSLLDGLGILTGDAEGNFALEQNLTRREFAAIITRMLAATAQGAPPFSDVAADDWAAGSINFVYENQIMTGYGDGTFRPDNEVTVQEVFKTLLAVLGYGPVMEAFGPYPQGAVLAAQKAKLSAGVKGVYDEPISRENLVTALYNALTIEYLSVQTFSGKDGLVLGKDKTLLEDLFHVSGKAGVLETAGMSTVNVAEELNKNTMSVSGEPFLCQGKNYENLLGYGVWVWYAQEDGAASKTAVGVVALDRNNVLKIAAKDLAAGQTDASQISYADKNGQTRTAKLADGVDVVKNGLPARADFNIPRGDITLVDNDGDKRYDAALIHTYETFAAKAATGNYLQDIDGNTYAINEENTTVYKDGTSISLGEIRQWDAIVLEKTDSPAYDQRAKIYVSDAKIEGTIEAVSKKDGTTITIDGRQYAFDNNSAASKATVGLAATFSVNAYGDIVGVDTTKTNQYAYLFGVSVKEQRLADDEVTLRVLRQDGTWASLGMAEKIKINGQGKTPADFLADAAFISPEKKAVRQVMKIKTNGRDEITEITSAQAWQGPAVRAYAASIGAFLDGGVGSGVNCFVGSGTVTFQIPKNNADVESAYRVIPSVFADGALYETQAYDRSAQTMEVGAIVYFVDMVPQDVNQPMKIITSVGEAISSSGEQTYCFEVYENGVTKGPVVVKDPDIVLGADGHLAYEAGDVIYYRTDELGQIISFDPYSVPYVFDYNTMAPGEVFGLNEARYVARGTVDEIADKKLGINIGNAVRYTAVDTTTTVTVFDNQTKKPKLGAISDLLAGDFVVARMSNYKTIEVIVYKN